MYKSLTALFHLSINFKVSAAASDFVTEKFVHAIAHKCNPICNKNTQLIFRKKDKKLVKLDKQYNIYFFFFCGQMIQCSYLCTTI